jgi:hypothetical protein
MNRHTRRRRALERDEASEREEPAAPSEPIEVEEHNASTPIIRRLRRFWTDRRS